MEVLSVVLLAVGTNYVASVRSKDSENFFKSDNENQPVAFTLESNGALLSCGVASLSLLLMFYFFEHLAWLIILSTVFSSYLALSYCLFPVVTRLNELLGISSWKRDCFGVTSFSNLVLGFICGSILASWLWTGHWMLNNLLGFSICVMGVSLIKVKNLKVACILLVCLFVYDIFWVFYSQRLFGENVMVSVAQKTASNPVAHVAKAMNIEVKSVTPQIELPSKMIIPSFDGQGYSILGLGDIAVPGLMLSFLHRLTIPRSAHYFWSAMLGYALGLVATMFASVIFHHAQPALLFLVPSTLIPVFVLSSFLGDFQSIWLATEVVEDPMPEKKV